MRALVLTAALSLTVRRRQRCEWASWRSWKVVRQARAPHTAVSRISGYGAPLSLILSGPGARFCCLHQHLAVYEFDRRCICRTQTTTPTIRHLGITWERPRCHHRHVPCRWMVEQKREKERDVRQIVLFCWRCVIHFPHADWLAGTYETCHSPILWRVCKCTIHLLLLPACLPGLLLLLFGSCLFFIAIVCVAGGNSSMYGVRWRPLASPGSQQR